jgi:hypothetical protein
MIDEASPQATRSLNVLTAQLEIVKTVLADEGWSPTEIATLLHGLVVVVMA